MHVLPTVPPCPLKCIRIVMFSTLFMCSVSVYLPFLLTLSADNANYRQGNVFCFLFNFHSSQGNDVPLISPVSAALRQY